jgi:hypothetical protein
MLGPSVIVLPSVSNQNVWLPVSDIAPDGTVIVPTTGGVDVSYTGGVDPTTWQAGTWESEPIAIDDGTYYLARVGIGTPGLAIPKGFWILWLRLNFSSPSLILAHSSIYIY